MDATDSWCCVASARGLVGAVALTLAGPSLALAAHQDMCAGFEAVKATGGERGAGVDAGYGGVLLVAGKDVYGLDGHRVVGLDQVDKRGGAIVLDRRSGDQ